VNQRWRALVQVAQKDVRMQHLDREWLARGCRKVAQVRLTIASASPEATAAASTCRSAASLAIAGSRAAISASDTSASGNASRIAPIRFPGLLGRRTAIVDEVASDLVEDAAAPTNRVEVLLSGAQERVAQRQGIQHTGVEHDSERHVWKMCRRADATGYR
jgi:hypothetical protein